MATFIGSHEKPFAGASKSGAGVNGDPRASSTVPHGRTRNRDKKHGIAQPKIPLVSPPMVSAPGLDHQDTLGFRLKDGSNVPAHPYAAWPRTASTGSPGGAVPKSSLGYGRTGKR